MLHRYLAGAFIVIIVPAVVTAWRRRRELPWAAYYAPALAALYAAQVAVAHPQVIGQRVQGRGLVTGHLRVEPLRGLVGQGLARVHHCPAQGAARCQLGAAFEAGAKGRRLGLCGAGKEAAVLKARRAHPADGPAVDAGAGHAGEEATVEARVARSQRQVGSIVV